MMSVAKTVAELEKELAALAEEEASLTAHLAALEGAAVSLPPELGRRLERALARLPLPPAAAAAGNGQYNPLELLEAGAPPSVLEDEPAGTLTAGEILFDEPEKVAAGLPDWLADPEKLAPAGNGDAPPAAGLDWLDDMAGDDFQAGPGASDDDLVESFLA
jgi:hypothetical protein